MLLSALFTVLAAPFARARQDASSLPTLHLADPPHQSYLNAGLSQQASALQNLTLGALSSVAHTVLAHPAFPEYSVRIKKSDGFCDAGVRAYTGYIDIRQARHLFFYFFESRGDPETDDVVMWTNGGPGCSSALGLFMELGPCRVYDAEKGPMRNPYAWTESANVFFVDQPVGIGFSYAEYGERVSSTEEAARDVAAFVAIFFETFKQFRGRAFHMAGESYSGRYIPLFAAEVYDQNKRLVETGMERINLQSIIIGNGYTDWVSMSSAYVDMVCTNSSVPPVASISSCVAAKKAVPRCLKWAQEACIDTFDAINCAAAQSFCNTRLWAPATGLNLYDITKPCDGSIEETMCYPITTQISAYLDRPATRALLGVDPFFGSKNFTRCSDPVGDAFVASGDMLQAGATTEYVAQLLERGVRVLEFAGTLDWMCNWLGNERWTRGMGWSGKEAFGRAEMRVWGVDGETAGEVRSARGLTFATVYGAGHMVPYDKPKEALALFQRWLANEEL
ncbi:serine carboxypeptidase [Coniophora puteana RWD-64-598 SS2]|uniref:carboxypeptidase C n=1 Tax=Coniophora puteana (strain RWD-64-598) TaxID=741705 RepID=R7SF69_CONPW|nr:serine carboxypeptidase [Coniophora puteana RWD-64-598 SS2]EIW74525.1 serine carboxypeptidase [Coniophora puteana RWD-64-598 SS2]